MGDVTHLNPPPESVENNNDIVNDIQLLSDRCTSQDVQKVIIFQINQLQKDVEELMQMKNMLRNIFPTDMKSYRSSYIIENKVKTFTGFHTTILSYKRELNSLLLRLYNMLNVEGDLDKYKEAIRQVMMERSNIQENMKKNKEKINELLSQAPSLMPTKL